MKIVVMLCSYKRNTLERQVKALQEQSVPVDLLLWNNSGKGQLFPGLVISPAENTGVWSRFTHLRDVFADFYAVVDDDTIPGSKWIEYCIASYLSRPKVICSNGVIFKPGVNLLSLENYDRKNQVGWISQNKSEIQVDWPGHSWFFDRSVLLRSLGNERPRHQTAGEDAHLAFSAQQIGQNCFVSRYSNIEYSGSLDGMSLGTDMHALWKHEGQREKMIESINFYRIRGWRWVNDILN